MCRSSVPVVDTKQQPILHSIAAPAGRGRGAHSPRADPRRALGRRGEDLAVAHLERLGYAILARNVRSRFGEIDVVALNGRVLVFVEVKTLCAKSPAGLRGPEQQPLSGLRPRQRIRLRRLASAWLANSRGKRPTVETIRFDAIGVVVDRRDRLLRLDHIEAAW
jgi:putative endonuclease